MVLLKLTRYERPCSEVSLATYWHAHTERDSGQCTSADPLPMPSSDRVGREGSWNPQRFPESAEIP